MQWPQIKIFRHLVLPIVLGLLAWWVVGFCLQPREERLFIGRAEVANYWPEWRSGIWQDQTGRFIAVGKERPYSYEPNIITLFDFNNPQTKQTIAIPSATKKGAQLPDANPARYTLNENLPSNQQEVIELHSPYPEIKLCRGWRAREPLHGRNPSYDTGWVFPSFTSGEVRWPTCWSNISLLITCAESEPWSSLRDLARKWNIEEWLWSPELVCQACLVEEHTNHILWSHETKYSNDVLSFQVVSGITPQQPVIPGFYAISQDRKSVLMLINKEDGTELSRWPIVLWSPWWARGAGMMVGLTAFAFPFLKRRKVPKNSEAHLEM